MSSSPTPNTAADLFEGLAPKREKIAYGLMAAGAVLAAIPIANVALYRWQSLAVFFWGLALSLFVLLMGVVYLTMTPSDTLRKEADRLRIFLLIIVGGVGFLTALLGFALPFSSVPFSITDYWGIFSGGVSQWRERGNALAVSRCGAALLGGLIVMFLGLLQARAFERTSPNLRRLLYGYNAILSSILLILILILVNMMPYTEAWPFNYAKASVDWTHKGLHSIHEATQNTVAGLKQPIKVYVLGPSSNAVIRDFIELLERCRAINPQMFNWEQLSRDRNTSDLRELIIKYNLPDSVGVLVVSGSDKKEIHEFIRYEDLFKEPRDPREPRYEFKGENALLNALISLSTNKNRAVIYFTQGNGEIGYKERGPSGLGQLIEDIGRINYETHDLEVAVNTEQIPADADIVVIARPAQPFPDKFLKALRDYLHGTNRKDGKKGKLIVLFDVVIERGKDVMVKTGLENLVAEYGVRVNENQVLAIRARDYLGLSALPQPRSSNAIAKAFANDQEGPPTPFYFYKARTLESIKRNPPGAPPSGGEPETLVNTQVLQYIVAQSDLRANPAAVIGELSRDPQKALEKIAKTPLPLAMAVSEGGMAHPPIPGRDQFTAQGQPRLLVFGDASWITNEYLLQPTPNNYQLFASCLSWLSERPDIGNRIPPTDHDFYVLKKADLGPARLLVLPGVLLVIGVFVLGLGVWVVRRR